jgi:hypothetical protein
MSNETQGYPDLELCELAYNQAFYGWVECYKDETGETAAQWVLLKASRQLWPAAFGVVESDTLTAVGIDRVKAWMHIDSPVAAPTLITATYQRGEYRTLRNNHQS